MSAPGHAEGVFAFSWSKWSTSPTLGRRQFVMRAADWADQGGAGTEQEEGLVTGGEGRDMELSPQHQVERREARGGKYTDIVCHAELAQMTLPLPWVIINCGGQHVN